MGTSRLMEESKMKRYPYILLIIFSLLLTSSNYGQGIFQKITRPDGIGGKIVATHLDGQGGMSAFGPGLDIFLRYNLGTKGFINFGTGYRTITDKTLSSNVWRITLLPAFELQGGYNLIQNSKVTPFVKGGLQAFGSSVKINALNTSTKTVYDAAVFGGGGIAYDINENIKVHASGDYRYVASATGNPKPKHWVAQVGMTYNLNPVQKGNKGEELEFDMGEGELALDDLFKDETTNLDDLFGDVETDNKGQKSSDEMTEDDALAMLFSPEEASESSFETEKPLYSESPEVNDMMAYIENLKTQIQKRNNQIEELQNVVRANERAIAELTSRVAGDYAGVSVSPDFSGLNADGFKARYEQGLQAFYNKDYNTAIQVLSNLLSSNPDHRLSSNCRYWIGESYNAQGNYRQAIDAFTAVMQYRSSYKFDDALLMNGICYLKIGDKNTARDHFQELVSRYPDSEYAPKAMRYLGML